VGQEGAAHECAQDEHLLGLKRVGAVVDFALLRTRLGPGESRRVWCRPGFIGRDCTRKRSGSECSMSERYQALQTVRHEAFLVIDVL